MLLYQYQVRDEFEKVKKCATRLRDKFESEMAEDDLLMDTEHMEELYNNLEDVLPEDAASAGKGRRHLNWLKKRLREGSPELCRSDIRDICEQDLPQMEEAFREWCAAPHFYDPELAAATSGLILQGELDSAVRKAFVLLTERMRSEYSVSMDCDGEKLVNKIFGTHGKTAGILSEDRREGWRNLLAGLYSLFRNKYGHGTANPTWPETEAVLSMVNYALRELPSTKGEESS